MKIIIRTKSFEDHKGRPGLVGGSLPRGTSKILPDMQPMDNLSANPQMLEEQDKVAEDQPKYMKNRALGIVLESGGDILREIWKGKFASTGYMHEKVSRILRMLEDYYDMLEIRYLRPEQTAEDREFDRNLKTQMRIFWDKAFLMDPRTQQEADALSLMGDLLDGQYNHSYIYLHKLKDWIEKD